MWVAMTLRAQGPSQHGFLMINVSWTDYARPDLDPTIRKCGYAVIAEDPMRDKVLEKAARYLLDEARRPV